MKTKQRSETSFELFTVAPIYYYKVLANDVLNEPTKMNTLHRCLVLLNSCTTMLQQIIFLSTGNVELAEISVHISYLNYFTVGIGKIICCYYNRRALQTCHAELSELYPSKQLEERYKLASNLRIYKFVEKLLTNFFKYILILYCGYPFAQSLYEFWHDGAFTYRMPLLVWTPVPVEQFLLEYIVLYASSSLSSFYMGLSILSSDLFLFSSVSQLCNHFNLLSQQILELQPSEKESLASLKLIIARHQRILKLSGEINRIFAPSIIFSLMSSSFILCFSAYQLLEDASPLAVIKTLFLLGYESKQVIITCYYGDKLMEASLRIYHEIYMHNWYDGSLEYRRMVLFMLKHMKRPVTLNVAGIADVSLITLKQVFGSAYQIFTVLKTT